MARGGRLRSVDPLRPSKRCPGCQQERVRASFYMNRSSWDGMSSFCQECLKVRRRAQYAADPEFRAAAQEQGRKWRLANPEKAAAQAERERQRRAEERSTPEGRARVAKANLRQWLRSQYGMTVAEYEVLVREQGGVCQVCRKPCRRHARLSVDHCHETGAIRGLLCDRCNKVLGMVEDSADLLEGLAQYVVKSATLRP